jgi:hypothetical protein
MNNLPFSSSFLQAQHESRRDFHCGRVAGAFVASLSFLLLFAVRPAAAQKPMTFNGTLADEHLNCLQNPVKAAAGVNDKTSCMLYWAHNAQPASKYVLYDESTKTTYQLDNQDLVQPYVGAKQVQITGTLDSGTKTIKVTGISVPDSKG